MKSMEAEGAEMTAAAETLAALAAACGDRRPPCEPPSPSRSSSKRQTWQTSPEIFSTDVLKYPHL